MIDVKYEKRHLRYDLEKRALIVPVDYLMLDYEDGEEKKQEEARQKAWYGRE